MYLRSTLLRIIYSDSVSISCVVLWCPFMHRYWLVLCVCVFVSLSPLSYAVIGSVTTHTHIGFCSCVGLLFSSTGRCVLYPWVSMMSRAFSWQVCLVVCLAIWPVLAIGIVLWYQWCWWWESAILHERRRLSMCAWPLVFCLDSIDDNFFCFVSIRLSTISSIVISYPFPLLLITIIFFHSIDGWPEGETGRDQLFIAILAVILAHLLLLLPCTLPSLALFPSSIDLLVCPSVRPCGSSNVPSIDRCIGWLVVCADARLSTGCCCVVQQLIGKLFHRIWQYLSNFLVTK
jgi:hypothetical protein